MTYFIAKPLVYEPKKIPVLRYHRLITRVLNPSLPEPVLVLNSV